MQKLVPLLLLLAALFAAPAHAELTAAPFAPHCHAAFETVSQIDFTDFGDGDDDLLLCGIHHRHLVIRRHRLFMWGELSSRDFRGNAVAGQYSVTETSEPKCQRSHDPG